MNDQVDVFYDNSPVFRMDPTAALKKTNAVGWFSGAEPLQSGWAWGQQYLEGGAVFAEASVGEGKVFLLGPEVNFRDQPHGTFKLLFNGLYTVPKRMKVRNKKKTGVTQRRQDAKKSKRRKHQKFFFAPQRLCVTPASFMPT
jgi:hypothetical protein